MKGCLPAILVLLLAASHLADAQQPAKKAGKKQAVRGLAAKIIPAPPSKPTAGENRPETIPAKKKAVATTGDRPTSSTSMSADLWIYLHEQKKSEDPVYLVRKKAAFKAEQRRLRIATLRWFGHSNSRPVVSPIMFTFSPHWSGDGWSPFAWTGGGGFWSSIAVVNYGNP